MDKALARGALPVLWPRSDKKQAVSVWCMSGVGGGDW